MLGKPHKVAAINQPLRPTPSHPHTPPPIFQMGQWGGSRGVTWPRLNTTEPEQSQNSNGGCLDPMRGSMVLSDVSSPLPGWRSRCHQPSAPSLNTPLDRPHLPESLQLHPLPWISEAELFSRQEHYSQRKARFRCCWGGGAGKKSAHKQLKQIRFLKNILLLPHTRAADGGGGSGRCPMLFCCGRRGQIPLIEPPCSAGSGGILRSDPSPLAGSFREASEDGWQGGLRSAAVQD